MTVARGTNRPTIRAIPQMSSRALTRGSMYLVASIPVIKACIGSDSSGVAQAFKKKETDENTKSAPSNSLTISVAFCIV